MIEDKQIENKDTKIWRYMDLAKFISILQNKALFLPSIEILSFDDPYEGSIPPPIVNKIYNDMVEKEGSSLDADILRKSVKEAFDLIKYFLCVSCWHKNEYESTAMWNLYKNMNEGIAIQTTFNRFKNFLKEKNKNKKIIFDEVKYEEYNKSSEYYFKIFNADEGKVIGIIEMFSLLIPTYEFTGSINDFLNDCFKEFHLFSFLKRKSFEHEKEIRVMTINEEFAKKIDAELISVIDNHKKDIKERKKIPKAKYDLKRLIDFHHNKYPGLKLDIDSKDLIENIYISPYADYWVKETVKGIVDKYNLLDIEVEDSRIFNEPIY